MGQTDIVHMELKEKYLAVAANGDIRVHSGGYTVLQILPGARQMFQIFKLDKIDVSFSPCGKII